MDLQLAGKSVVITGATRGIGRACAAAFAAEGARLVLVARDRDSLERVRSDLPAAPSDIAVCPVDVAESGAGAQAIATALRSFGTIDILVANAGSSFGGGLVESGSEDWDNTYRLNVGHAVDLLRAAVPAMRANRGGSAVFISSISGRLPVSRRAQYAASKAALTHAARSLALELAADGIRVNSVSPGSVFAAGGGWDRRSKESPEAFQAFQRAHPLGRLGTPEEIARVVAFVASAAASWINGADIAVDGAQWRPSMD